MRARAFALRDAFADVLRGIRSAEEERDMVPLEQREDGTYGPAPPRPTRDGPAPEDDKNFGSALKIAETQPVETLDAGEPEEQKRKTRRREQRSEYDKVVSYVDREACIVLSEESWKGDRLAKLLTVDPDSIERHDYVHYAATQRFEDCLEGEHTDIQMEEPFLDCDIAPKVFDEKSMGQRIRRPRCQ